MFLMVACASGALVLLDGCGSGEADRGTAGAARGAPLAAGTAEFIALADSAVAAAFETATRPPVSEPAHVIAEQLPLATDIAFAGPLRIVRGGTYRGNWRSADPAVPAVTILTREPVVIEHSTIVGAGDLIVGFHADLTVRDSHAHSLYPGRAGLAPGRFVRLEEFSNALVENNDVDGTSGIYFRAFEGDVEAGQGVRVLRNRVRNIDGRHADGTGGYGADHELRQFVQLDAVRGVPAIVIGWNEVINTPGASRVEDNISIFNSGGTAASPARIHDNYIEGAYPFPLGEPYNGGGIMVGDTSQGTAPDEVPAHVWTYGNQVVNSMGHGIAIAAGNNLRVFGNRVLSSGWLPDGSIGAGASTVGIYVWEYLGSELRGVFFDNSAAGNLVATYRLGPRNRLVRNDFYLVDCAVGEAAAPADGNVCSGNASLAAHVDRAAELAERDRWRAKVAAAGIVVGIRR